MRLLHVVLLALLVPVTVGLAQTGFQAPAFPPFPEKTVDGVVERIDEGGADACQMCQACSDCAGTHLVLRKGSARIHVHLAPAWFLDRCGFTFTPGDLVSVTGTRITIGRERGIAAREVRRGLELMRLRDERGLPLWRRELTDLDPSRRRDRVAQRVLDGADERRGR